jgi:hypothetical protein
MTDVIRLRYPSTSRLDGYGTIEVHPPYPAQEHTAVWMHAHLDAHRDADGVIDTCALFRAAMRHDGVSWQPWTPTESTYRKLAVYVAHTAGQPWHL